MHKKTECKTQRIRFITALHALHAMQSSHQKTVRQSVRPLVCPSVRLSNAWIVTKRNKVLSRFLYCKKDHLS